MENEEIQTTEEDVTAEETSEEVDWKARAEELEQKAIKQRERTKELKAKLSEYEAKKVESNEPDYARLAFLEQRGITHPDDQKIVQDEATRLKLPLTDILAMKHIKTQLDTNKDQRDAVAGMPKGRGKGGGQTQADVDYWLAKGETPDDQDLAEKVIEARIKKETSGNKFSDELYT